MVKKILKILGVYFLDLGIKYFVRYADKNKDGSVSAKEMKLFLKDVDTKMKRLIKRRNIN
jgi:hypothetical protein